MSGILRYYLDLLRGENDVRYGLHNILSVMKQSRKGYVLNECFDNINMRNEPLVDIHFSDDDGKSASSFRGCNVTRSCFLSGHSAPIESMEFIDDNTLVSKSANEVITWDIKSGVLIEMAERNNNEIIGLFANSEIQEKAFIVCNSASTSFRFLERKNNLYKKVEKMIKTPFEIIAFSSDDRLVYLLTEPHSYFLVDTKTETFFDILVSLDSILKIDSSYIFFDRNKKQIYEYNTQKEVPTLFSLITPFSENVSLKIIINSRYIFAQSEISLFPYKQDIRSYIIDVSECKIAFMLNEKIVVPIYIAELDCFLIRHKSNIIELIRRNDFTSVCTFEGKKSFILYNSIIGISKSKKYIAFPNHDFGVNVYTVSSGKIIKELGGQISKYNSIISNDRENALLLPYPASGLPALIWDVSDNQIISRLDVCYEPKLDSIFISLDNSIGINSYYKQLISIIDFKEEVTYLFKYNTHNSHAGNTIVLDDSRIYEIRGHFYPFNSIINIYNKELGFENSIDVPFIGNTLVLSQNNSHLAYIGFEYIPGYTDPVYEDYIDDHEIMNVVTINLNTKISKAMRYTCICPIHISNDGRYVTVVKFADFDKAIIKTEVLDMHEKAVCPGESIKNDYVLLNYLRQYVPKQQEEYTSSGWTIKVPSSPDNSTEALIYLVPNLYISGCDFRDSSFDDETKEIIRQYNGIV